MTKTLKNFLYICIIVSAAFIAYLCGMLADLLRYPDFFVYLPHFILGMIANMLCNVVSETEGPDGA